MTLLTYKQPLPTIMDLLNSASVPCHDNENALVTDLSCNDNYIAVALTNAYVHVFSCLDCSHVASFKDPCGEFVWAVSIVDDKVIIGSVDGALRVWRVNERSDGESLYNKIPLI